MTDFLEYNDISCEMRGAMISGKLKLTDDKLQFKPLGKSSSSKAEQLEADQVEMVNWQRLAGSWGIRVFTKDGTLHRYAGFKEAERERLAKFFKSAYSLDMLDRELSVKGWNWGSANFNGGVLTFEVGKSDSFELPLAYVNQCNAGKNEVTLEFHQNDDAAVMLNEVRFHIPPSDLAGSEDPVEEFRDQVLKKASVVTTSGETIALFDEVKCLTPKGQYQIKIFPTFFHLHGKTFDYKISTSSVVRIFVLPDKDERDMMLAVNVDPPIKQGNTRYHYLVCQFKVEDEMTLELPFTDEELAEKYDSKLQKEMEGPTFELISRILKVISGKKLMVPGSFKGHTGTPSVSCSHKTATGSIYPLDRGFIFMYKPPIYIRYDEIRSVDFERSGGSTRSFDIKISTTNDLAYTFSSIDKAEYSNLYEYVKNKKVKVLSSGKSSKGGLTFEEKSVDHIKERYKADAQELSDSGSLSSDDSDFNPDNLEALSAKEEYDSEPSETSSDEESDDGATGPEAEQKRAEKAKRKAEKQAKKEKRAAGGGGGSKSSSGPKRERKKKMTKLPGQPKKYMSAYFLWMNSNREQMKKDYPGLSLGEFGKKAGELWKAMTDKSEWEQKSAEDRKRYESEYAKWLDNGGKEMLANAKKEAKAAKRAEKRIAAGGTPKKKSSSSSKPKEPSADPKGGSGGGFKSKEFIEDSDSSDGGSDKKDSDEDMKSASSSGDSD